MRILTSDERRAIDAARNELLEGIDPDSIKLIIAISAAHRSGFITALDHSAAQIAALQAENASLREGSIKLLAYILGNLSMGEIEETIETMKRELKK